MEMHQVRYFLAVARTLNFTRAAEECHVTQPALTRAVHLLEEELGGELLRRERMLTHLTELGRRMLPLMQQCYDSALSAKSLAQSINAGQGSALAIALSSTLDLALLTTPLAELFRICPNAQLRVRRTSGPEIAELLKKGEVELAVAGPLGAVWERLDTWPLFTEPLQLVVEHGHPLAGQNTVEPDQLTDEPLLIQSDAEMGAELALFLGRLGISTARAHHVSTDGDLIALAEARLGVAIIPASAVRSDRLRTLPLQGFDLARTVAVYGVAGRRRSPAAAALLNLLRAADWSRYLPERALLSASSMFSIAMRRR